MEDVTRPPRQCVAVIGDVVGSRQAGDELFHRLREALAHTNDRLEALQPLQITIGDEFQGLYGRLGQALNATLLVNLLLHDVAAVRFGVGVGELTRWNPDTAPYEQDGPAWWHARAALQAVDKQERATGMPNGWRTAVRLRPEPPDARAALVGQEAASTAEGDVLDPSPLDLSFGAALDGLVMFRDHALSRLDQRDVELVLALLAGASVTDAAAQIGISQQAVSRRLGTNGGYALIRGWRLLEGAG